MTYKEAHKDLVKKELDVQSILKKVKDEYRTLYDDSKWPAASHAKDSKAMNRNYGSVNKATADLKKLLAAALVIGTLGVAHRHCSQPPHPPHRREWTATLPSDPVPS